MKDFKGTTGSEIKLFTEIQKANGSYPNGIVGTQTMTELAIKMKANCFPLTVLMYNQPTIVGHDIIPFNPKGPLSKYQNSALGSFTYPRATKPCSILITGGKIESDGRVKRGDVEGSEASRYWAGYPEAVMYKANGKVKMGEFKLAREVPGNPVEWAVGGFGLGAFWNPDGQGFKKIKMPDGKISDFYTTVAYRTNHLVLGYKNGMMYLVFCKNMTAEEVNKLIAQKFLFEYALLLDGGGLAAMNGEESFAKIKTNIKQGYAIQMV
jgi:hypothetical protein